MKKIILSLFFLILIYTRFVGLDWGLPYPMHPDERNMAIAVQELHCEIRNTKFEIRDCMNPRFFAYGQFPLYLGRLIATGLKFFDGDLKTPVSFQEAIIGLRIISAIASVISVFIILKIIEFLIFNFQLSLKSKFSIFKFQIIAFLLLTFSSYAIQFSHFGTTESLLMLFYSLIIYLSFRILDKQNIGTRSTPYSIFHILSSITCGLAIATKVSATAFLAAPILAIIINAFSQKKENFLKKIISLLLITSYYLLITIIFSIIFSPHNFISFNEFLGSMRYESDVALGHYVAFYTRQFVNSIPIAFQMLKVFPYTLGWPQFILAILGFLFLPWRNKLINFLRFAFLIYFLPNAFVFAKWSRFMAPILPIMSIFSILFLISIFKNLNIKNSLKIKNFKLKILELMFELIFIIILITPGIAYLSIYFSPDVRFTASNWVYKNIPSGSKILSETANVVDIPISPPNTYLLTPNYNLDYISFNFYDLDENVNLQQQLEQYIREADYIFVPSRRIWTNHTCENFQFSIFNFQSIFKSKCLNLKQKYPLLNDYYEKLFFGALGFTQVAEFTSYPKISLFGKTLIEFPDEQAEETWSIFDHPVIRIYKRNPKSEFRNSKQIQNSNFQNYQTTTYPISPNTYHLLIADTPEKWERGLMDVRSKEELNGADGMIFIFPSKGIRSFWNNNTYVDLDLYWLNDEEVIGKDYLPSIDSNKSLVTIDSPSEINKVIEIIK